MATDAVTFIRALGLDQVDLHGFSMGGMIAQLIAQDLMNWRLPGSAVGEQPIDQCG